MSLCYDFDIHWLLPEDSLAQLMSEAGFQVSPGVHYVAHFRDPRTVAVLKGADPKVRSWLEHSGFGFNTYDSGAGKGRYPAKDEMARLDVIERLSDSMKDAGLKGANFNGFHLPSFLKAVLDAKPVGAARAPLRRTMTRPRRVPAMAPAGAAAAVEPAQPGVQAAAVVQMPRSKQRPAPAPPSGVEANIAAVLAIDAAFANPKAGAAVKPAEDGREPTIDDLMAIPERATMAVPAGMASAGTAPADDLRYHPTALPEKKSGLGMSFLPIGIGGGALLVFLLFVALK